MNPGPINLASIPEDSWELLSARLSEKRRARMEAVATHRTKHVRLVLQDIHDPHNVAACLRSAEALGVLDIDIITTSKPKSRSAAARGSSHWLRLQTWPSIRSCCEELKKNGYKIAAGFPEAQAATSLYEVPIQEPIALLFGNEHRGLDPEWLAAIDYKFTIPTVGMVESLNISVAAAISLSDITRRSLLELGPESYYVSEEIRTRLLGSWLFARNPRAAEELLLRRQRRQSLLEKK